MRAGSTASAKFSICLKIDIGLKALAHNLRKLALAWANSSFFDKFLSSGTAKQLYTNPHLSFYPKLMPAVANAA